MFRGLLLILGLMLVATVMGVEACAPLHVPAGPTELAAGIALVAGVIAVLPVSIYRGTDLVVRFQMAWVGTILHLVLSAGLGVAALLLLHPAKMPFVVSLLAMYWVSLAGVCGVLVKAMRGAATELPGVTGNLKADPG